jgi:hypothetical protein
LEKVGFHFPVYESDQWDGFNDSGMEHFAGDPFVHLGRETTQNSIDAPASEDDPVRVRFSQISIPVKDIPNLEQLSSAITSCHSAASEDGEKAKQFFDHAKEIINKKNITILKVEDFNTNGVKGPCKNGTPFFALLKATGQSKKESDTSAGSFGIGKFAPFNLSRLRTIFISTVWKDDLGDLHHYVQGKSRLMSFVDAEGKTHQATGFWGEIERCQPVTGGPERVAKWLRRAENRASLSSKDVGTTLYVLGFPDIPEWREILAATIAENFFGAIDGGKLVVEIDEGFTLTKTSLQTVFEDPGIGNVVQTKLFNPETWAHARAYYQALTSADAIRETKEQLELGQMEVRILVRDKLPKTVGVLRHGMFITDSFESLKRFPDFKDFIAVLRCVSAKGNKLLREMEPPRHDSFEPARLIDKKREAQGRRALREVGQWVRDMLKRHARDPVSDVTRLDEMAEFFSDDETEADSSNKNEVNPAGVIKIAAKRLKSESSTGFERRRENYGGADGEGGFAEEGDSGAFGSAGGGANAGDDIGGDHAGTKGSESRGSDDDGAAAGGDKGESAGRKPIELHNVRAVPVTSKKRRIAFSPSESGELLVSIQAAGADRNRSLMIASTTSSCVIVNGSLSGLKVDKNERISLEIELTEEYIGAVKVVANAV